MVNTVTGKISAESLGKTLIHEHFCFGYPGFQGDVTFGGFDFDEALRVGSEAAETVKKHGVKTVVDPTPNECGRNPELLKAISEKTGVQIVCTTGYYYSGEGATAYWRNRATFANAEEEIYDMMMTEINVGIGKTGVKAGAIKVATSYQEITKYERMFLKAAARVQKETDVPIITHTERGTMGPEQARFLIEHGANPKRILIGHMDGNSDVAYQLETLEHGVFVGFDRFGLQSSDQFQKDNIREATLHGLLGMGFVDQLMLSHDTVNFWMGRPRIFDEELQKLNETYYIGHLFDNVVPRLKERGVSEETLDKIFIDNPRRLFGE